MIRPITGNRPLRHQGRREASEDRQALHGNGLSADARSDYGDNFRIECLTGSGETMNLFEVTKEIAERLSRIFLQDERGRRPVCGATGAPDRSPLA
jgi:hypothetical protein